MFLWLCLVALVFAGEVVPFGAATSSTVVTLINGQIKGLSDDGSLQWSFSSGGALVASSSPLIIPGLDGSIYLYNEASLSRHPLSVQDLVSKGTLEVEGFVYLGSKETNYFKINPVTGAQMDEELSVGTEPLSFSRVDYHIQAIAPGTGQRLWNITFGQIVFHDGERCNLPQLGEAKARRLISHKGGRLELVDKESGNTDWHVQLESLVVGFRQGPARPPTELLFAEQVGSGDTGHVMIGRFDGSSTFALVLSNGKPVEVDQSSLARVWSGDSSLVPYQMSCSPSQPDFAECIEGLYLSPNAPQQNQTKPLDELPAPPPAPIIAEEPAGPSYFWYGLGALGVLSVAAVIVFQLKAGGSPSDQPSVDPTSAESTKTKKPKKHKKKVPKETPEAEGDGEGEEPIIPPAVDHLATPIAIVAIPVSPQPSISSQPPQHETPSKPTKFQIIKIDNITVDTNQVLGYGSGGTVVYVGTFGGRKVAVKRMMAHYYDVAKMEIQMLIESDEHPSLLRYYAHECDSTFVYLALSCCSMSLHDLIISDQFPLMELDWKRDTIAQLLKGIQHLHNLNIIHRDIKPRNILLDSTMKVKISDMGLAKKLSNSRTSFSTDSVGTPGWQAPEMFSETFKTTKKVDIFAVGCVAYNLLTGSHPYGDPHQREMRIIENDRDIHALETFHPLAHHFVDKTTEWDPNGRFDTFESLSHIFFWSADKQLQFIKVLSDKLVFLAEEDIANPLLTSFDIPSAQIIGQSDWSLLMDEKITHQLNRFHKYDVSKISDLLRFIRNKSLHYREFPEPVKELLGPMPHGYLNYFCSRFPQLVVVSYMFMTLNFKSDPAITQFLSSQ